MSAIADAAAAFRRGGVLLYPTTTLWGLGGDARLPAVHARIAQLKGRAPTIPFLVLVSGPTDLAGLVTTDSISERLMERYWPGPLTLLLPAGPDAPPSLIGPEGLVGVRQVEHPAPRALLVETGGWLISTSANRHGDAPPLGRGDVHPSIEAGVDIVCDLPPAPGGAPSTIVAVEGGQIRTVREGAIAFDVIWTFIHSP